MSKYTEKELQAMKHADLLEAALGYGLEVDESMSKADLKLKINEYYQELDESPEETSEQQESVVETEEKESAFQKALKSRKFGGSHKSILRNELNRRQGKRTEARSFLEELRLRKNKGLK